MNHPRDHHFIPAFYLKHWSGEDGKLVEYSRKNGKLIAKPVGPRATGFQTDIYAFPELPPEMAQHLEEKFFEYADRKASEALELHLGVRAGSWDSELLSAWSRFVIGIHLRHPDAIPELRTAAKAIWEGSGVDSQIAYEKLRKHDDPVTYDEYLAKIDPLVPEKACLNLVIKTLDNDIVGNHINQMRWSTVDLSRARYRLLTSDRPVEMFSLKEPKGILSVPISPTRLFVAVNEQEILRKIDRADPDEIVRKINLHTASRARRFVWAPNDAQNRFVENHMSRAMETLPLFPRLGIYQTPNNSALKALVENTTQPT